MTRKSTNQNLVQCSTPLNVQNLSLPLVSWPQLYKAWQNPIDPSGRNGCGRFENGDRVAVERKSKRRGRSSTHELNSSFFAWVPFFLDTLSRIEQSQFSGHSYIEIPIVDYLWQGDGNQLSCAIILNNRYFIQSTILKYWWPNGMASLLIESYYRLMSSCLSEQKIKLNLLVAVLGFCRSSSSVIRLLESVFTHSEHICDGLDLTHSQVTAKVTLSSMKSLSNQNSFSMPLYMIVIE